MNNITLLLQLIIALGILNVWLLRANRATDYRGGDAKTMEEEFRTYGLSRNFMMAIGGIKLSLAALLIIGIWYPTLTPIAASVMAILMLGAIAMHVKVRDPIKKTTPAISMFLMSIAVATLTAL